MTDEEKKPHHCEKELAQFIRTGAVRRPDQAFGDYYRGRSASCALGAAYEGMYRLPTQANGLRPRRISNGSSIASKARCASARTATTARKPSASPRSWCISTTTISGRAKTSPVAGDA